MAAIHADLDAVPEKGHDTVTRHNQFSAGIVGLRELAYVFYSWHWSLSSFDGQGLSRADNTWQARFKFVSLLVASDACGSSRLCAGIPWASRSELRLRQLPQRVCRVAHIRVQRPEWPAA